MEGGEINLTSPIRKRPSLSLSTRDDEINNRPSILRKEENNLILENYSPTATSKPVENVASDITPGTTPLSQQTTPHNLKDMSSTPLNELKLILPTQLPQLVDDSSFKKRKLTITTDDLEKPIMRGKYVREWE